MKANIDLKDLPGPAGHDDYIGIGDRVSQVHSNISLCEQPKCRTFETVSRGNYVAISSFAGETAEISGKIIIIIIILGRPEMSIFQIIQGWPWVSSQE